MQNIKIENMKLIWLPGRCPKNAGFTQLHNQAFDYWRNFWNQVSRDLNTNEIPSDHFLRQDLIAVLMHDNSIVGMHLYTVHNLESHACCTAEYFLNNYGPEFVDELKKRGAKSSISLEYFTLNPAFRKSQFKTPIAVIIAGLGYRYMQQKGIDSLIGVCRKDFKVDEMAIGFGGEPLVPSKIIHNVECELIATFKNAVLEPRDLEVRNHIQYLWDSRIDYTQVQKNNLQHLDEVI